MLTLVGGREGTFLADKTTRAGDNARKRLSGDAKTVFKLAERGLNP